MDKIYKYPIKIEATQILMLPKGNRVISVIHQGGHQLQIYAIVDEEAELVPVTFELYGTGHAIRPRPFLTHVFIGTVEQGPFVWHLFKLI